MKVLWQWWLATWRQLPPAIGYIFAALITATGTIIAAVINSRKKKDKEEKQNELDKPAVASDDVFQQAELEEQEKVRESIERKPHNINYRRAEAQEAQLNYAEALRLYLQAAADYEEDLDSLNRVVALNQAGILCNKLGHYDMAIKCFTEAQAVYKADPNTKQEILEFAGMYTNLAVVFRAKGDNEQALIWYNKALKIVEERLGNDNIKAATIYCNMGVAYEKQHNYQEALDCHLKAMAIFERKPGTDDVKLAAIYNNIAVAYEKQEKYEEALEYHFKALVIKEKKLGKTDPDTAMTYNNLGVVYSRQGKHDLALEHYFKALRIREKILGSHHPSMAETYGNIASVYADQKKYNEAIEKYLLALRIVVNKLSLDNPITEACLGGLHAAYEASGRKTPFEKWLKQKLTPP